MTTSGVLVCVMPARSLALSDVAQPSGNTQALTVATIDEARIFISVVSFSDDRATWTRSRSCTRMFLHLKPATDGIDESLGGGGAVAEEQRRLHQFEFAEFELAIAIAEQVDAGVQPVTFDLIYDIAS